VLREKRDQILQAIIIRLITLQKEEAGEEKMQEKEAGLIIDMGVQEDGLI